MIICKVMKNGVETNRWIKSELPENHWEPSFGEPGTYTIVEEDINTEVQDPTEPLAKTILIHGTEEELTRQAELKKRDLFLQKTDFTQLADAPFSSAEKTEFRDYRDYLREFPTLFQNGQILQFKVMTFEEWKLNKPVY